MVQGESKEGVGEMICVCENDIPMDVPIDEIGGWIEEQVGPFAWIDDPTLNVLRVGRDVITRAINNWRAYGEELRKRNEETERLNDKMKAMTPVYADCMACGNPPGNMLPNYADGFEVIKCRECWRGGPTTSEQIRQTLKD